MADTVLEIAYIRIMSTGELLISNYLRNYTNIKAWYFSGWGGNPTLCQIV